jgi:enoyl-CoA hydratase/carnithine racemase
VDAPVRHESRPLPAALKPVICAINGAAAGLGLVMALDSDFRVASDKAVFATAFAKRGLIAEHGIAWMLPRIVGHAHATDLLLTSSKIDAQGVRHGSGESRRRGRSIACRGSCPGQDAFR